MIPEAWKLQLPVPPDYRELKKISPTRLDSYRRCPFTFYLCDKEVLGDKRLDDRTFDLARWEFGNLVHAALESWGLEGRAFDESVDRLLAERFGDIVPEAVVAQGVEAKARLARFAERQARYAEEGWRVAAVEHKFELTIGHTLFFGKCDRIDCNERTGEWRVVDYKTWDELPESVESLQLPLYCAMLEADAAFPEAVRGRITSAYCVLGRERTDFTAPLGWSAVEAALGEAAELVSRLEKGIFWPPSPAQSWRYDYGDWLFPSPEESVASVWLADQQRRVESLKV